MPTSPSPRGKCDGGPRWPIGGRPGVFAVGGPRETGSVAVAGRAGDAAGRRRRRRPWGRRRSVSHAGPASWEVGHGQGSARAPGNRRLPAVLPPARDRCGHPAAGRSVSDHRQPRLRRGCRPQRAVRGRRAGPGGYRPAGDRARPSDRLDHGRRAVARSHRVSPGQPRGVRARGRRGTPRPRPSGRRHRSLALVPVPPRYPFLRPHGLRPDGDRHEGSSCRSSRSSPPAPESRCWS